MVSVPSVFTSGYVNTETILYFFILTQLAFHVSSPQTGLFTYVIIIEAFPKPRTGICCTKFPSQLIRIFTHYAALFKNSKQSINMLPIKSADSRADKMLDIQ